MGNMSSIYKLYSSNAPNGALLLHIIVTFDYIINLDVAFVLV